jgi:tetratricopeptide (TPR) repeat protein
MSSVTPDPRSRTRRKMAGLAGVAALVVLGVIGWRLMQPRPAQLWSRVESALADGQDAEAMRLAEEAMLLAAASSQELVLAGTAAARLGRLDRAEELFSRIDPLADDAASAWRAAGSVLMAQGRVVAAERLFRAALERDPDESHARLALCELLRLGGRHFELAGLLRELIDAGTCPSALLFAVAVPDRGWLDDADRKVISTILQSDPQAFCFKVLPGDEAVSIEEIRDAARASLGSPAYSELMARWGTGLAEAGRWRELADWDARQNSDTLRHSQVWHVRGLWQREVGNGAGAIRCFREALEREPFHAGAIHQLTQLLRGTPDDDHLEEFVRQGELLGQLRKEVVFGNGAGGFPGPDVLRRIVQVLTELGRDWEVLGWSQLARLRHPDLDWPTQMIGDVRTRVRRESPWIADEYRITRRLRPDHTPLKLITGEGVPSEPSPDRVAVSFDNVASARGLRFAFDNGSSVTRPRGLMYEISGGGAAALDYDLDGWPDLFLTNGGPTLDRPRDPAICDRLFRNREGRVMDDVTTRSGIREMAYGQGAGVGDLNSDGFPDLFVANIGRNELWINQGDGTFLLGTDVAGLDGSVWTMSVGCADLNRDGLTDLYEANYLAKDALTRTCVRDGVPVQCRPTMFAGEPDRVWLNQGDGRFLDVSESSGVQVDAGKSMGLVAVDLEGSGRLSLYVANDMEPNNCYRNLAKPGERPQFVDDAVLRGLAVDGTGRPLASMGIAADDVDQDGWTDFYVTNFLSQASNLYVRQSDGQFADKAPGFGIHEPSSRMMGWGAQFIDINLDGWPDLVVANGHLEDYSRWQIPSLMPTQIFINHGGQRFDPQPGHDPGPYFHKRHLGRAVTRFDGNRDGREDLIVTHVDAPVAWLENTTTEVGHRLVVRLAGTVSERHPIGCRLIVSAGGRTRHKQLTAGDGFQASNQGQLVFGLGESTEVESLRIEWPSGTSQEFSHLPVDREILFREGDPIPYVVNPPGRPID